MLCCAVLCCAVLCCAFGGVCAAPVTHCSAGTIFVYVRATAGALRLQVTQPLQSVLKWLNVLQQSVFAGNCNFDTRFNRFSISKVIKESFCESQQWICVPAAPAAASAASPGVYLLTSQERTKSYGKGKKKKKGEERKNEEQIPGIKTAAKNRGERNVCTAHITLSSLPDRYTYVRSII